MTSDHFAGGWPLLGQTIPVRKRRTPGDRRRASSVGEELVPGWKAKKPDTDAKCLPGAGEVAPRQGYATTIVVLADAGKTRHAARHLCGYRSPLLSSAGRTQKRFELARENGIFTKSRVVISHWS